MTQEKQSFWDHLDILREGVSKCMLICILMHFLYLMKKGPYFHKLGPLLLPKVFVTLGKVKITSQNYIIFLTYKTRRFFFRNE